MVNVGGTSAGGVMRKAVVISYVCCDDVITTVKVVRFLMGKLVLTPDENVADTFDKVVAVSGLFKAGKLSLQSVAFC